MLTLHRDCLLIAMTFCCPGFIFGQDTPPAKEPLVYVTQNDTFIFFPSEGSLEPYQALREINQLMDPLYNYFGHKRELINILDSASSLVIQQDLEHAYLLYGKTLKTYYHPQWSEAAKLEIRAILDRIVYAGYPVYKDGNVAAKKNKKISYHSSEEGNMQVEKIMFLKNNGQENEYKKIQHDWGGVFYFFNGMPVSKEVWSKALDQYSLQEKRRNP